MLEGVVRLNFKIRIPLHFLYFLALVMSGNLWPTLQLCSIGLKCITIKKKRRVEHALGQGCRLIYWKIGLPSALSASLYNNGLYLQTLEVKSRGRKSTSLAQCYRMAPQKQSPFIKNESTYQVAKKRSWDKSESLRKWSQYYTTEFDSHSKSLINITVVFKKVLYILSRKYKHSKHFWLFFNHCVKGHLIYLGLSVLFSWSWQPFFFLSTNLSFIISAVNRLLIIVRSKASSSMFYCRSKRESPSASKAAASFVLLLGATALSTRFSSR